MNWYGASGGPLVAGLDLDALVEDHAVMGTANDVLYTNGAGEQHPARGVYIADAKRQPIEIIDQFGQGDTDDVLRVRRATVTNGQRQELFPLDWIKQSTSANSSLYGRFTLNGDQFDVVGYTVNHNHIFFHLTQTVIDAG